MPSNADSSDVNSGEQPTASVPKKIKKTSVTALYKRIQDHPIQKIDIPMLTTANWTDWNYCARSKLRILGLSDIVFLKPEDDAKEMDELARIDQLVLDLIMLRIDESIRRDLYHITTIGDLWSKLEDRFEGDENTKAMNVFALLIDIIEKETQDLAVFVSKFSAFYRELTKLFPDMDTRPFVGLLFALLPKNVRYLPSVFRTQGGVTVTTVLDYLSKEQRF